ncbi:MAG: magnesium chelatase subunit D [Acidobacteria bacterium]|nr:magnesium chelatase subunit D [Acidobacteriota bacterium]
MSAGADHWSDAALAAALLAVDPVGLGGACLRARAGPVRDGWLALLARLTPEREVVRVPVGIEDDRLIGGLDLAATLATGRPVFAKGLLAEASGKTLVLPMAERCPAGLAARIGGAADGGAGFCLVALDEGADPDEAAPAALTDRLAFAPRLEELRFSDQAPSPITAQDVLAARARLPGVRVSDDLAGALATVAAGLGIGSLRAPILALRAARAAAALAGELVVSEMSAAAAARLVLAPRARYLPPEEDEAAEEQPDNPPTERDTGETEAEGDQRIPEEMLLEAVRAAIPDDLLARLLAAGAAAKGAQGAGAGADRRSHRRGRPAGTMRGTAREGARVDLIATLRTAAPWQPLRRQLPGAAADRVLVRADDIRVKRFRQRAERVVIFVVDASGSTALARLAEAKGAIELMLGQAYVERQQVALIAFRGTGAEILLPPTRSLVMTKRRLAGLPGGGGTPLAGGLRAALELALAARRRGLVPHLAMLTDGRANVALDGTPGRGRAQEDALKLAQAIRYAGVPGLVIDTGNRPSEQARAIAAAMGAIHLPLPRADARALSAALDSALAGAA